jgi:hypothetical protein
VPYFLSLNTYTSVSLEDIIKVKLLNRIDRKLWFNKDLLESLLYSLKPFYDVLEIDGQRIIKYQTIYFDFSDNELYHKHHNGYRDRYKIRRRKYSTSNTAFFEVKRKTNKERTIKSRIEVPFATGSISKKEQSFLKDHTPYCDKIPEPTLFNSFNRITLIDKRKTERCTIDFGLKTWNNFDQVSLNNLVVIELKRGSQLESSTLIYLMNDLKIRQKGLSKYCTGRALLEPHLKQNVFKPRLLVLNNKILNNNTKCLI